MRVVPIGRRQAGALTILWVLHPHPVKASVVGEVLEPGGNNTIKRRALRTLIARGLVAMYLNERGPEDILLRPYRITDEGIEALRRYALRRGGLTREVIG